MHWSERMSVFQIKSIKPQKLRVDAIRLELLNELRKQGTATRRELEKTVRTWQDAPRFETIISLAGGDAAALTGPVGSEMQVQKFVWLDKGTRIRWAVMSRDWQSKTRPGRLNSGPGSGRVVIAGRRAMQARNIRPRPGIEARNWTEIVASRRKRPYQRAMVKAMQRAAQKAFR
jgi:hypothetical protein